MDKENGNKHLLDNLPHDIHMGITWYSYGYHMILTWVSHYTHMEIHMMFVHMGITRLSHDVHMGTTWFLHDIHMDIIWVHMGVNWLVVKAFIQIIKLIQLNMQ